MTLWTVPRQAPLSMEFSRQEYWSGLLFPPEHHSNPQIKPKSPASPALADRFSDTAPARKPLSVGGFYEYGGLPVQTAARRKDLGTKKFAANNHTLPFSVLKKPES